MHESSSQTKLDLKYVYFIAVVAALGGVLFGYDTGAMAGAIFFLGKKFALTPVMTGWAVSCGIIGSIIGSSVAGSLSDRVGRKKLMMLAALFFAAAAGVACTSHNITLFLMMRLVAGFSVGTASMLSPLYISESAPSAIRGRLGSLYQLAIVSGFFAVYFVNLYISSQGNDAWNIDQGWRLMFAASIVPAILYFGLLFLVPESPSWLTRKNRDPEAQTIWSKIGGEHYAQEEIVQIKQLIQQDQDTQKPNVFSELKQNGSLRAAMGIGCALAILQQVTGINVIMYYAPTIFKDAGAGTNAAMFSTLLIGATNLLFTFVAIWLIDRLGRKFLLLSGSIGMTICLFALGLAFKMNLTGSIWVLLCILGYVASFAVSLGPVVWVVISEIFPVRIRGQAMSIATMVLWIATFLVSQTFPSMLHQFGSAVTFWTYMVMSIVCFVFVQLYVPETKGKSPKEISSLWSGSQQPFPQV